MLKMLSAAMNFCAAPALAICATRASREFKIEMRKNHFARAGKPQAVDDAGMVGAVGENDVVGAARQLNRPTFAA